MGFIRGFLFVIVCGLLFLSILCTTLLWTLSRSLEYDTLQEESVLIIKDFIKDNNKNMTEHVDEIFPSIQSYCQNHSEYVFSYQGNTVDIPCETALQGTDAIIEESMRDSIKEFYYAEYNCNFLDCMKESRIPVVLISEKAYNYWTQKAYLFLTISLVLSILLFFLAEKKTNVPILLGSFLIVASLPFIKLDSLLALYSGKNPLIQFLMIFFSQSYIVSLRVLIMGVFFLIVGIMLKIFKVTFFISNLISKIRGKPKVPKEKQQEIPEKKQVQTQKNFFQKKSNKRKRYK